MADAASRDFVMPKELPRSYTQARDLVESTRAGREQGQIDLTGSRVGQVTMKRFGTPASGEHELSYSLNYYSTHICIYLPDNLLLLYRPDSSGGQRSQRAVDESPATKLLQMAVRCFTNGRTKVTYNWWGWWVGPFPMLDCITIGATGDIQGVWVLDKLEPYEQELLPVARQLVDGIHFKRFSRFTRTFLQTVALREHL